MGKLKWHTYRSAAERVNRSERAIRLWGEQGMPLDWQVIEGQRTRVVREDILLATFREKLKNDPVRENRNARRRREEGLPAVMRPITASTAPKLVKTEPTVLSPSAQLTEPATKPMKGGPEYVALDKALRGSRTTSPVQPGCRGDDAFTADRIDGPTAARLARVCADCPALELCRAFADVHRPTVGFWAGMPAGAVTAVP